MDSKDSKNRDTAAALAAAVAEESGRHLASPGQSEPAEVLLAHESDTRPSLAPLESWEVFKLREIGTAVVDFEGFPEIQEIFSRYRDDIIETARGRNAGLMRLAIEKSFRFSAESGRSRARRAFFGKRREEEGEER